MVRVRIALASDLPKDTGWRDVSSLLVNGWTGGSAAVCVRRIGPQVFYRLGPFGVDGTGATASPLLEMPPGFTVDTGGNYGMIGQVSGSARGTVEREFGYLACDLRTPINGLLSGFTNDPWPTTLPGTPA